MPHRPAPPQEYTGFFWLNRRVEIPLKFKKLEVAVSENKLQIIKPKAIPPKKYSNNIEKNKGHQEVENDNRNDNTNQPTRQANQASNQADTETRTARATHSLTHSVTTILIDIKWYIYICYMLCIYIYSERERERCRSKLPSSQETNPQTSWILKHSISMKGKEHRSSKHFDTSVVSIESQVHKGSKFEMIMCFLSAPTCIKQIFYLQKKSTVCGRSGILLSPQFGICFRSFQPVMLRDPMQQCGCEIHSSFELSGQNSSWKRGRSWRWTNQFQRSASGRGSVLLSSPRPFCCSRKCEVLFTHL